MVTTFKVNLYNRWGEERVRERRQGQTFGARGWGEERKEGREGRREEQVD